MWETAFEESMLCDPKGLAIHCPDKCLAEELFEIFKRNEIGTNWNSLNDTKWFDHEGDTTYYIAPDKRMLYGPKRHGNDVSPYRNYTKCTFYGTGADPLQNVEVSEDEFLAMLNA